VEAVRNVCHVDCGDGEDDDDGKDDDDDVGDGVGDGGRRQPR